MTQEHQDPKEESLHRARVLNPRPEAVRAPEFVASEFFDARDLLQVKYEMLRRVTHEGATISEAASTFGFSRPSFYEARSAYEEGGIPGLLPKKPGPRRAHKLSEDVIERLILAKEANPSLSSADLAQLARDDFGLRVHPRSVERALARYPKDHQEPTL